MGENADTVRAAVEALVRGDIEALVSISHPDVEWVPLLSAISGESYRGHEGLREWYRQWTDVFGGVESKTISVEEHGDDVLVESEVYASGLEDAPPVGQRIATVVTIRDGKASRAEVFADRDEARRRVGIEP